MKIVFLLDAAYKMLGGNSPNERKNFQDLEKRTTRPDLQSESDVHAKLAVEHHSKKPHEGVDRQQQKKDH
jgi:hypothetical protein